MERCTVKKKGCFLNNKSALRKLASILAIIYNNSWDKGFGIILLCVALYDI